ncbi:MAG: LacI family DNA-binding transcriptional regulator [Verrucomicrobia bacterium]|nr:LacI family DNA-binding transcriptional regulator [Verrucomicrobiota bacterium]
MTLFDLAKELNVSISTISRALSRPEVVAPATRDRILTAARRFGFQPNVVARSLRTRETRTIGIVVPDITNWFFGLLVKIIDQIVQERGYTVVVCNADEKAENETRALGILRSRKVTGIINCPVGAPLEGWQELLASGIPLVELDRRSGLPDVDAVVLNDEAAAAVAAEHFLQLGHTRIATIGGPQHLSNGRARLKGFKRALQKAACPSPSNYLTLGDFTEDSGRVEMARLLACAPPPTAVFIANSEMTGGALAAIRERQIRIPRDLSLIGFDDARWTRYLDPPLTAFAHPVEDMGRHAAELLLGRLDSKKPSWPAKLVKLDSTLIVRNSTSAPRPEEVRSEMRVGSR